MTAAVAFLVFVSVMVLAGVGIGARQAFYSQILTNRIRVDTRVALVDSVAEGAIEEEPLEVLL